MLLESPRNLKTHIIIPGRRTKVIVIPIALSLILGQSYSKSSISLGCVNATMSNANMLMSNQPRLSHLYQMSTRKIAAKHHESSQFLAKFDVAKESELRSQNSLAFSPTVKKTPGNGKYLTQEKKRRTSRRRTNKKYNQASLVRNKDYT